MKIYVVRHGETNSNLAGIVSGRSDEELNENGIKQAQDINLKIADMKFADVYVSPMKRTIQTAEIVVPEYKYIIDDRLAERELGKLKG
ncbi:histidine phosphatase family protein, partial [Candidatus Saccharibacteria bacterium]|nr:histidine phosphatase family protein [Candidatus Saccharibacteria bacterium]